MNIRAQSGRWLAMMLCRTPRPELLQGLQIIWMLGQGKRGRQSLVWEDMRFEKVQLWSDYRANQTNVTYMWCVCMSRMAGEGGDMLEISWDRKKQVRVRCLPPEWKVEQRLLALSCSHSPLPIMELQPPAVGGWFGAAKNEKNGDKGTFIFNL